MSFKKILILLAIALALFGKLVYNIIYLKITENIHIPAGVFLDLTVIIIFFIWLFKRFIKKPVGNSVLKPSVVKCIDSLMLLFILYIGFNYIRGFLLGNTTIFSEGRGFLYYLLFFPMVSAIEITKIKFTKVNKLIFYTAVIFLVLFVIDIQGVFLPFNVSYIEGTRGFEIIESGLTRTSMTSSIVSVILFLLSFFIFLASKIRADKTRAFLVMLISLFICFRANTRGYQLGLILGLIVSIITCGGFYKRYIRRYIIHYFSSFILILFLGCIIFYFFFPQQVETFFNRWGNTFSDDFSVERRLVEVKVFGLQFLKHPILGNNIGTQMTYKAPNWTGESGEITTSGPHTEIIYWLYTLGIVGTGLFIFISFLILKIGVFNVSMQKLPKEHRLIQKGILVTLFSLFIISFSSWNFRYWIIVPFIVMMFAYTRNLYLYSLCLSRKYKERNKDLVYS